MTRGRVWLLAMAVMLSCDDDDESSSQVACIYDYSVYSTSEYGINFDEYSDECVTLESADACDDYTEDSNTCAAGFCSEYSYTNVRVVEGTCETVFPPEEGDQSCQWTNDGECDEPEGTGLCAEGTDTDDCA
jgi:hypothetical protein